MRNFLLSFSIFLFALFNALGDNFLQQSLPGVTQGQVIILFILISFFNYKLIINSRFLLFSFIVLLVTIIFFILGGFKNMRLLYTIFGSVLLGIATFNPKLQNEIIRYSFFSFLITGAFISFAYYFGFWSVNSFTGRSSFMGNNENIIAGLLCFSYGIALFNLNKAKVFSGKFKYFLLSLFFIVPLIATGSRSGVLILVASTLATLFVRVPMRFRKIFIVTVVSIVLMGATIGISIQDSDSVFSRFKTLSEDDRFEIWSTAKNLVFNNIFTGVGFGNFNDENWRIANDLFLTRPGFKSNSIEFIPISLHNSFLDLIFIGGLWLLVPYLLIIFNLVLRSLKFMFSKNHDLQILGAFILSVVTGIFIFSFGGQGATDKYTWVQFGICYSLIWQATRLIKLKYNQLLNENRI